MASYKRNIFIINPKFQFRISFLICSLFLILTIIYPLTIYELINTLIDQFPSKKLKLSQSRDSLLMILILIQVGMLGLIFVISIFVSHKIAGPMYKLKIFLRNIREKEKLNTIFFRKGDYFPEIADEINQTLNMLKDQRSEDFKYLEDISSYMANLALAIPDDKKPVLEEIQRKLTEIQTRYS